MHYSSKVLVVVATCLGIASAFNPGPKIHRPGSDKVMQVNKRQLPAEPTDVLSITTSSGVNITYKEPGNEGICETTPGVKSYAGFVNLAPDVHSFFWWFESRRDPVNDPITLWLNGGPGSDSLIGLFQELGPCNISEDLVTQINPYAWNNVSNMLFLSQPLGVGFSYGGKAPGSMSIFGSYLNAQEAPPDGRYPVINATAIDTTDLAAVAAWEVIQGFLSGLPQLAPNLKSKTFNLATESYGGHYGPAFFNYFYNQNQLIANGSAKGVQLDFNSLTIINGIIDEYIQAPYYPEFAVNNTYGIKAYNQSIYDYTQIALNAPVFGCLTQIESCYYANQSALVGQGVCTEAANECRDNVESPYYAFGGRGVYDIRHPYEDPTPPDYIIPFLNQASVQDALGVDTNYTSFSNTDIYYAFQQTGDFVYPNFLEDLEHILNSGVRVSLIYGDADYICNWFGGEAVSLAVNYTHTAEFRRAGYIPMTVDGVEYGETREFGNFSFTRVYEAGHEVPYYQPIASLQLFNRTIFGFDTATGTQKVSANLITNGTAQATHTESFVPLPSTSSASPSASATSAPKIPIIPRNKWARYEKKARLVKDASN
ncbi:hypothetical protein H2198_007046 [Neophaeococcomyces mojaviensis]|uniref:Uncharacterized protein n=1 Tax=Neophaeococcomyces mojaviensis TaxID=3383035 RepID=A0ACC3A188_9EURO|nr:hypothetical protein H2198_007046 [Knufia sp. JES_112]